MQHQISPWWSEREQSQELKVIGENSHKPVSHFSPFFSTPMLPVVTGFDSASVQPGGRALLWLPREDGFRVRVLGLFQGAESLFLYQSGTSAFLGEGCWGIPVCLIKRSGPLDSFFLIWKHSLEVCSGNTTHCLRVVVADWMVVWLSQPCLSWKSCLLWWPAMVLRAPGNLDSWSPCSQISAGPKIPTFGRLTS